MNSKLRYMPQHVLEEAAKIADGNPRRENLIGKGLYTAAYKVDDYVIKTAHCDEKYWSTDNSPSGQYHRYQDAIRKHSAYVRKIANAVIIPTVVLFDDVVVQPAITIAKDDVRVGLALEHLMVRMGDALGVVDIHDENWGLTKRGQVAIFDYMPDTYIFPTRTTREVDRDVKKAYTNLISYLTKRKIMK
jgi:hypothetical protein